jgi:hypothetical protein
MKIQKIAFQKAVDILDSLNCQYAIIDADGKTHGTLLVEKKPKRQASIYPQGEMSNYVKPYLETLKVGGVAELPIDKYTSEKLQAAACNWMRMNVGKDTFTTHVNKETKRVEVLRIL